MAQPFAAWLDDFFASYYHFRPVNATFIGIHDHDHALPDFSTRGVEAVRSDMAALLARLPQTLPPTTDAEAIDRRLAEHYLHIQEWEFGSRHFQGGNPSLYTGEAIFGLFSLFLFPVTPRDQRVAAAIARMEATPTLLAQGRENLRAAPPAWTLRAIRECDGALRFFDHGLDLLIAAEGISDHRFRAAAMRARDGFTAYQHWLRHDLLTHPTDGYGCGGEAFDRYLRIGHELAMDGMAVDVFAREQFAAARSALEAGAAQFGARDWQSALAGLAAIHPTIEEYDGRFQTVWDNARAAAEAHDLITWPDFPIQFVPRPAWARACAPYLYFLSYYCPAPYDHRPPHRYLFPPIEPSLPPAEQERQLRAINESVIKLNHVIHHGGIGHHIQNWHAPRAPSRIGQIAGVDTASRIALFCAGTMVEGWASYVVDLMDEVGFLTPLERYSQCYARLRASARAIVDVNLHHGRFSFDDAVAFYRDDVGMSTEAATGEAVKNSMFPGAAMIYLIGQAMIYDLRRERAARAGAAFSLRRFHDQFLSYGAIPVSLIAQAMRAESPSCP
ncbi:MAG: DUF885 family protein [Thermomicrobiales bacterium]